MNTNNGFTIQALTIAERIEYYEQELRRLISPVTFRERVLANVYRALLQSCFEQNVTVR